MDPGSSPRVANVSCQGQVPIGTRLGIERRASSSFLRRVLLPSSIGPLSPASAGLFSAGKLLPMLQSELSRRLATSVPGPETAAGTLSPRAPVGNGPRWTAAAPKPSPGRTMASPMLCCPAQQSATIRPYRSRSFVSHCSSPGATSDRSASVASWPIGSSRPLIRHFWRPSGASNPYSRTRSPPMRRASPSTISMPAAAGEERTRRIPIRARMRRCLPPRALSFNLVTLCDERPCSQAQVTAFGRKSRSKGLSAFCCNYINCHANRVEHGRVWLAFLMRHRLGSPN